jgi:hypothetical protein
VGSQAGAVYTVLLIVSRDLDLFIARYTDIICNDENHFLELEEGLYVNNKEYREIKGSGSRVV